MIISGMSTYFTGRQQARRSNVWGQNLAFFVRERFVQQINMTVHQSSPAHQKNEEEKVTQSYHQTQTTTKEKSSDVVPASLEYPQFNAKHLATCSKLSAIPVGQMGHKSLRKCFREINRFSNYAPSSKNATWVNQLLERLADEFSVTSCKSTKSKIEAEKRIDISIYNLCLNTWNKSGDNQAFLRCHDILDSMIHRNELNRNCFPAPDKDSYKIALESCKKSSDPRALLMAEKLIHFKEEKSKEEKNSAASVGSTHDHQKKKEERVTQSYDQTQTIKKGISLEYPQRNDKYLTTSSKLCAIPLGKMGHTSVRKCFREIKRFSNYTPSSKNATLVQQLLKRLADEFSVTSNKSTKSNTEAEKRIDVSVYNLCLNTWNKSGDNQAFLRCHDILNSMIHRNELNPDCFPAPDIDSYRMTLTSCTKSSDPRALEMADKLIHFMEGKSKEEKNSASSVSDTNSIHPTLWFYNLVILAYANQAEKFGAASKAEEWLMYLAKIGQEGGPCPDVSSFNCVLKAWSYAEESKGADRAFELFNLMIKLYNDGSKEVKPNVYTIASVINAMARRGRAEEAESVLQTGLNLLQVDEKVNKQTKNQKAQPTVDMTMCFNAAINAWAKSSNSDNPKASERAEALLTQMQSLAVVQPLNNIVVEPDATSFTASLDALFRSGRPDAPETAELRLVTTIENYLKDAIGSFPPNTATFDIIMRAWVKSKKGNRAERVQALFDFMIELSQRHRLKCGPNTISANLCISAWCQSLKESPTSSTKQAVACLLRMEKMGLTNSVSYINVINALLDEVDNHEGAHLQAATILQKLHQYRSRMRNNERDNRLDRRLYDRVLLSLSKIGTSESADMAYEILQAMEQKKSKTEKPTIVSYTAVIMALSKPPKNDERVRRALDIFSDIVILNNDPKNPVRINTRAYDAILGLLANVREPWAAKYACDLVETMILLHSKGNDSVEPDFRTYDKCVKAVVRCGLDDSVARAANLLVKFVQDFKDGKTRHVPSQTGFSYVITAYSNQNTEEANTWIYKLTTIMDELKENEQLILKPLPK